MCGGGINLQEFFRHGLLAVTAREYFLQRLATLVQRQPRLMDTGWGHPLAALCCREGAALTRVGDLRERNTLVGMEGHAPTKRVVQRHRQSDAGV